MAAIGVEQAETFLDGVSQPTARCDHTNNTEIMINQIQFITSLVKTGGPSTITGANVTTWEMESWNCSFCQQIIRCRLSFSSFSSVEWCTQVERNIKKALKGHSKNRAHSRPLDVVAHFCQSTIFLKTWTSWGQFWAMTLLKRKQMIFGFNFDNFVWQIWVSFWIRFFLWIQSILDPTCRGDGGGLVWVTLRSDQPLKR